MKTRYREVLELRGKPITNLANRKPSKKVLERFKDIEKSYMFQLHLIAAGIRKVKEGVAK